jgi:hypothetical protein
MLPKLDVATRNSVKSTTQYVVSVVETEIMKVSTLNKHTLDNSENCGNPVGDYSVASRRHHLFMDSLSRR